MMLENDLEWTNLIHAATVFKLTLGEGNVYRPEAIANNVMLMRAEEHFYQAVMTGASEEILRAGWTLRTKVNPKDPTTEKTIGVWRSAIEAFTSLDNNSLILNYDTKRHQLYWGLVSGPFEINRKEKAPQGHTDLVLYRPLRNGWQTRTLDNIELSGLHPRAQELVVNRATLNRINTDADYFKALILAEDTTSWESDKAWAQKGKNWRPKNRELIKAIRSASSFIPADLAPEKITEISNYFWADIKRMADTALKTVQYANGQLEIVQVKEKNTSFNSDTLPSEIHRLLVAQNHCCALTGYDFKLINENPHLKPSLDRKNSSLGYIEGNLQIVTRAANFYKSASDPNDWALKAAALAAMAVTLKTG